MEDKKAFIYIRGSFQSSDIIQDEATYHLSDKGNKLLSIIKRDFEAIRKMYPQGISLEDLEDIHQKDGVAIRLPDDVAQKLSKNIPQEVFQNNDKTETTAVNILHEYAFNWLESHLKRNTNFTCWLRHRNTNQRLDNGFWFQGTEHYASVGLFNLRSNNQSTKSIAIVFWPSGDSIGASFDVIYNKPQTDNSRKFYEELKSVFSNETSFAEKLETRRQTWFRVTLAYANPTSEIDRFLEKYYDQIMGLLGKYNLEDGIISKQSFDKYLRRIQLRRYTSLSHTNDEIEPDFKDERDFDDENDDQELNQVYSKDQFSQSASTEIQGDSESVFLNTQKIAEYFADTLIKSVAKPISKQAQEDRFYGVFGRWGRGKTHFWNLVKRILHSGENKTKFITIDFHAWKYQDTPGIWAYLYETLAEKYYVKTCKVVDYIIHPFQALWLNLFRDPIQVLFSFISFLFLIWTVFIFPSLLDADVINTLSDFFSTENGFTLNQFAFTGLITTATASIYRFRKNPIAKKASDFMRVHGQKVSFKQHLGLQHETQEELKELLNAWTYCNDKKIILFVDDIDRCSYDRIIDIVDSIRVMINYESIQSKLIVLAAIDERILFKAIRKKYDSFISDTNQLNLLCYEYFDKLFIAGIKLSRLDKEMKKKVLMGIIENQIVSDDVKDKNKKSPKETSPENLPKQSVSKEESLSDSLGSKKGNSARPEDNKTSSEGKPVQFTPPKITVRTNQISVEEASWMKELIEDLEEATPRSIRNFTIKYRMARGFVELQVNESSDVAIYNAWYSEEQIKLALMEIVLSVMNRKKPNYTSVDPELIPIFEQSIDMVTFYRLEDFEQSDKSMLKH